MTAIASSEFMALARAQLRLLTQHIAEVSAAVYIADYVADRTRPRAEANWERRQRKEPNFIPVVSYPEPVDSWISNFERATAWRSPDGPSHRRLLSGSVPPEKSPKKSPEKPAAPQKEPQKEPAKAGDWPDILHPDRQLVVPLVYAEVVVGLMVAIRGDRAWESEERHYVEGVAESLAAGCVLERRTQWLQSQLADKRDLQSRQSEIFHNLLHQFRNPLTAVTTFGQLLVRRLEPEDPNHKIATGIVRESKRLREMVAHFDETVALGDADLQTAPTAPLRLPSFSPGLLPSATNNAQENDAQENDAQENSAEDNGLSVEEVATDLDLAGVQTGQDALGHALTCSAQYLPDILEPILAVADIVASEKAVTIQTQVAADTPAVWGEEEALGEVVSNLIDNAVKYSAPGACVWVQTGVSRTSESRHYQGVVVGDTGPGIPLSDLERLFERNYRGVQATSDIPGTGLGLAIAQSLMSQMQGFIEVTSPAVGTPWIPHQLFEGDRSGPGTVFIVWLQEANRQPSLAV